MEEKKTFTKRDAKNLLVEAIKAKRQNKLGEALILLVKLAEELFNINKAWADLMYAEMLHHRGSVLMLEKNWAGAYEELLDSARMRRRLKDHKGLGYTMFQIAMLKMEQTGDKKIFMPYFLNARTYLIKAMKVAEEQEDFKTWGDMKHNNAFIYQIDEEIKTAITLYTDTLKLRELAEDMRGEALTMARLAECYVENNEIDKAEEFADPALTYFRDTDDRKRVDQALKVKKQIVYKRVDELAKELETAYSKATTREEYNKVCQIADKIKDLLDSNEEILSKTIKGWWARYYEFLKFIENYQERKSFVKSIERWYETIRDSELRIGFGYLYAVALADLIGDIEKSEKISNEIEGLAVSSGKTHLLLQTINARGIIGMSANFKDAILYFNKIDDFMPAELLEPECLPNTANILNNRGISQIRGKLDAIKGTTDLLRAIEVYSLIDNPPAKHFERLKNRMREAVEYISSEDIQISNKDQILHLAKEARDMIAIVGDDIKSMFTNGKYFQNLRISSEIIREKIEKLYK